MGRVEEERKVNKIRHSSMMKWSLKSELSNKSKVSVINETKIIRVNKSRFLTKTKTS